MGGTECFPKVFLELYKSKDYDSRSQLVDSSVLVSTARAIAEPPSIEV